MYFQQSDILKDFDEGFVKEFTDLGEKKTYNKGRTLFREGDPASYFFVLLQGSVKITIGETGHSVYSVDQSGEIFGWSSLLERDRYSASAECMKKTSILRIHIETFSKLLEKDTLVGMIFFKRLAGVLGNRLLQTYESISSLAEADISRSYGTGQVLESDVKVS